MSKPRTHRKTAGRAIRVSKGGSAREAIGRIEKGTDTYILTFGQFSLVDALIEILEQVGAADVTIATWTAADAHLQRCADLLEGAAIRSLRWIVDRSFETRQPEYCFQMRRLFGEDCFRFIRSHAKFMLIRSESHDLVVRTSMNLNENPRLESLEISEDREFAEFFQRIVDEIFGEVEVGEKRSRMLELPAIEDTGQFGLVEADRIERGSLNEVETSHVIRSG